MGSSKRVNYDCKTGDQITFADRFYYVKDTFPDWVRVWEESSDIVEVFSYATLWALETTYVELTMSIQFGVSVEQLGGRNGSN